jgi:hypothetical protein
VLLDATVIRAVLLPAVMQLLGERNWYLPRGLRWLPHSRREASPADEPGPGTAGKPGRAGQPGPGTAGEPSAAIPALATAPD